jgi:pimeloyl-ACP methyl ester carboxylesterase
VSERAVLIMLPGLMCDASVFSHQMAGLADLAEVRVPNLFGYDSLVDMAQAVLADAPPRFALLGFSMGGRVALEVARLAPERLSHLVLMDTGLPPAKPGEAQQRQGLVDLAYTEGLAALAAQWLPATLYPPRKDDPALIGPLTAMVCRGTPEIHEKHVRALMTRPDAAPVLPMITCPTLAVAGRFDKGTPYENHVLMAAAIKNGEAAVIEESGHFASVEQPEAFTRVLRDWLVRQGFGAV